MSVSTTTNYELKKPSDDEFYDVSRYRDNMDAVDTQMKANADAAANALKAAQNVDMSGKADKATTIAGYNISDAYTKAETDTLLNTKVNTSNLAKVASTGSYADLTGKPDDELLERDAHLHRDITHVAFDLKIKGLIDDSEYDCLSVDTIDAATDVNLTHGKFSNGFVYI
ncbi:MAG: hypothetical protein ACI4W2_06070 [Eubacterium sp.]